MTKHYEQRKEANKRYLAKLDELKIRLPKGRKSTVEALAKEKGDSVNGLINGLLRDAAGLSEGEWKQGIDATEAQPIVSEELWKQAQDTLKKKED